MKVLLNFAGMVAESICCQMLWRHSLASEFEAVSTIRGEPMRGYLSLQMILSEREDQGDEPQAARF